jgi:hypothetical protein
VVLVALDLPAYFALRARGVPCVYQQPLSGRALTPWCVERWRMPAWRLAHHAKVNPNPNPNPYPNSNPKLDPNQTLTITLVNFQG